MRSLRKTLRDRSGRLYEIPFFIFLATIYALVVVPAVYHEGFVHGIVVALELTLGLLAFGVAVGAVMYLCSRFPKLSFSLSFFGNTIFFGLLAVMPLLGLLFLVESALSPAAQDRTAIGCVFVALAIGAVIAFRTTPRSK